MRRRIMIRTFDNLMRKICDRSPKTKVNSDNQTDTKPEDVNRLSNIDRHYEDLFPGGKKNKPLENKLTTEKLDTSFNCKNIPVIRIENCDRSVKESTTRTNSKLDEPSISKHGKNVSHIPGPSRKLNETMTEKLMSNKIFTVSKDPYNNFALDKGMGLALKGSKNSSSHNTTSAFEKPKYHTFKHMFTPSPKPHHSKNISRKRKLSSIFARKKSSKVVRKPMEANFEFVEGLS